MVHLLTMASLFKVSNSVRIVSNWFSTSSLVGPIFRPKDIIGVEGTPEEADSVMESGPMVDEVTLSLAKMSERSWANSLQLAPISSRLHGGKRAERTNSLREAS